MRLEYNGIDQNYCKGMWRTLETKMSTISWKTNQKESNAQFIVDNSLRCYYLTNLIWRIQNRTAI
jgi:hypothetical protein